MQLMLHIGPRERKFWEYHDVLYNNGLGKHWMASSKNLLDFCQTSSVTDSDFKFMHAVPDIFIIKAANRRTNPRITGTLIFSSLDQIIL